MNASSFKINLDESFETLPKAPIVEAIIHWQAQPAQKLDPPAFLKELQQRFPDYPTMQSQHELSVNHQMGTDGSTLSQSHAWQAFQLRSRDNLNVAQFGRIGLAVNRLAPYERWEPFRDEALRLWNVFLEIASPPEVQRLGVRYTNLLAVESVDEANQLLSQPVSSPGTLDLPVDQFMHQAKFDIPARDYGLNLIQTIQPTPPNADHKLNLIVDIDVFTTSDKVDNWETNLETILAEMRWVKNKVFFGVFTESTILKFKE
jgi:uncharacterized protein (TIGR04255 family)